MNTPVVTQLPVPVITFEQMERMAHSLVKSGLFGLQNVDQALALMAIAQAEGKHPAIIARDFHIIEGRPSKKAEAMLRDFVEGGGHVEWHALDDTIADATFSHPQGGTIRITWDIARAQKAGLVGRKGDMYGKYPRAMLRSRCVSEGVRSVGPFATSGTYTPEELRDSTAPLEAIKDVTPRELGDRKLEASVVIDYCSAIEGASDLDDLRRVFQMAYTAAKAVGDFAAIEQFELRKDARKSAILAEEAVP